jgi:hypothetical protein
MTEKDTDTEQALAVVVDRIVNEGDNDRLKSFCSLLNSFNYAVQVQGNRNQWEPKDFRAFAIALCAMDQINEGERVRNVLHAVEDAMHLPQNRYANQHD